MIDRNTPLILLFPGNVVAWRTMFRERLLRNMSINIWEVNWTFHSLALKSYSCKIKWENWGENFIFWNNILKDFSEKLRIMYKNTQMVKCYVRSVLLCGGEDWKISLTLMRKPKHLKSVFSKNIYRPFESSIFQ